MCILHSPLGRSYLNYVVKRLKSTVLTRLSSISTRLNRNNSAISVLSENNRRNRRGVPIVRAYVAQVVKHMDTIGTRYVGLSPFVEINEMCFLYYDGHTGNL